MLSHYALLYVQIVFTTTNWDLKLSKVGGQILSQHSHIWLMLHNNIAPVKGSL